MAYLDDQGNPSADPPSPWNYPGQGGPINEGPQNPTPGPGSAPTAAAAPTQAVPRSPGNTTGRYTSADVARLIKQLTGRDPSQQEAQQWGDNIDQQYYDKIRQAVYQTPEAQAYQKQLQNGGFPDPNAPKTPPTSAATDWASQDFSSADQVKAYAKSRGVDMSDETANYWAQKYNSPEFAGDRQYFFQRLSTDPAFGGSGGSGAGDLTAPWTDTFNYQDFKAPTQADLLASPGFQSSLDRASNILQRSAAAKGSLLSGSTAQALSDQTADLTTQGYANLFNQNAQTYQANRANAFGSYQDREAAFYNNQNNAYAKLMGMAALQEQDTQSQRQTNLGYAGLGANNIQSGAAAYNGLLTGGANAAASGIVGGANAYSSLYGSLSQYPWLLAAMGRGGRSGGGGSNYGIGSSGGYYGP